MRTPRFAAGATWTVRKFRTNPLSSGLGSTVPPMRRIEVSRAKAGFLIYRAAVAITCLLVIGAVMIVSLHPLDRWALRMGYLFGFLASLSFLLGRGALHALTRK